MHIVDVFISCKKIPGYCRNNVKDVRRKKNEL